MASSPRCEYRIFGIDLDRVASEVASVRRLRCRRIHAHALCRSATTIRRQAPNQSNTFYWRGKQYELEKQRCGGIRKSNPHFVGRTLRALPAKPGYPFNAGGRVAYQVRARH